MPYSGIQNYTCKIESILYRWREIEMSTRGQSKEYNSNQWEMHDEWGTLNRCTILAHLLFSGCTCRCTANTWNRTRWNFWNLTRWSRLCVHRWMSDSGRDCADGLLAWSVYSWGELACRSHGFSWWVVMIIVSANRCGFISAIFSQCFQMLKQF